jgi:hypothetical protein
LHYYFHCLMVRDGSSLLLSHLQEPYVKSVQQLTDEGISVGKLQLSLSNSYYRRWGCNLLGGEGLRAGAPLLMLVCTE